MSVRRRVLFIISSLQFGGMEKHTVSLLNGLDPALFELSLATLRDDDALLPQVLDGRIAHRVQLRARGKLDLAASGRLRAWLRAHPQDVIVCVNEYPMLYARLALRGMRPRPSLAEIFHTTVYRTLKERIQLQLYRRLLRDFDLLIYVSTKQQEYWRQRRLAARRDTVIHNGIDVEWFADKSRQEDSSAVRRRLGFAPDDFVVAICAALRPEKAHGDMVAAIARLRHDGLPAKGLFVGDGPERTAIESRIRDLGLDGHVVITGLQKDVRPYLQVADVFALCSHAIETFSVAALEAMAAGRPLVMTRIGGAEEQAIEGVNGFLYEPGDIDALTAHLHRLADVELRHRMGASSVSLVRASFTAKRMLECYTEQLLQLDVRGGD